jgi:hypothetical protein
LQHFIVHERPLVLRKAQQLISYLDKQINLLAQRLQPQKLAAAIADTLKYAFLYSGAYDSINAHIRFWNDFEFMYNTLTERYGFPEKNIIVIYADGKAEDGSMPVGYPATIDGFKTALNALNEKLTPNSTLFIFFTNHGSG